MSSSKRSTIIVEHLRKQQMWDSISKGKRLDGRDLDEISWSEGRDRGAI